MLPEAEVMIETAANFLVTPQEIIPVAKIDNFNRLRKSKLVNTGEYYDR